MRFLIDEDLPESIGRLLQNYGYDSIHIRDIGLKGSKDSQIASFTKTNNLCLVTGDFDFSNIRNYPPSLYPGIIVLSLPRDATADYILNLFENFLKQNLLISDLQGKLIIVEPGRVRIRR